MLWLMQTKISYLLVPLTTSMTRVHYIPYTTSHQLYRVSHRVITRKRFSLDVGVIGTHTLCLIGLKRGDVTLQWRVQETD